MGCGASTPSGDVDVRTKYIKADDKRKGPAATSGIGTPAPAGDLKQEFEGPVLKADDSVVGCIVPPISAVSQFVCPRYRVFLKPSPANLKDGDDIGGTQLIDFVSVLKGKMVVRRPPPGDDIGPITPHILKQKTGKGQPDNTDPLVWNRRVVTVASDFSGNFTIVLSDEEIKFIVTTTLGTLVVGGHVCEQDPAFMRIMNGGVALSPSDSGLIGTPTTPPLKPLEGGKGGSPPMFSLDGGGGAAVAKKKAAPANKVSTMKIKNTATSFLAQHVIRSRLEPAKPKSVSLRVLGIGASRCIASISLSSDEKVVAFATVSGPELALRRLNQKLGLPAPQPYSLLISHALSSIALTVRTVCLRTGRDLCIFRDDEPIDVSMVNLFFTPDNQYIVGTTMEGLTLWDSNKRKKLRTIAFGREFEQPTRVTNSATSRDGRIIACAAEAEMDAGCVGLFRDHRQYLAFSEHKTMCTCVAFLPDSSHCVSAEYDGSIIMWSTSTAQIATRITGHTQPVTSLVCPEVGLLVSVDGRYLRGWRIPKLDENQMMDEPVVPIWTRQIDSTEPTPFTPGDDVTMAGEADRKRFSRLVELPGGLLAVLQNAREVLIVDPRTGETFSVLETRAPVLSMTSGYNTAIAGDLWGNIYALDFDMGHSMPNIKI